MRVEAKVVNYGVFGLQDYILWLNLYYYICLVYEIESRDLIIDG